MQEALAYVCHYYKIQTGNPTADMTDVVLKCKQALGLVEAMPEEKCGSCRLYLDGSCDITVVLGTGRTIDVPEDFGCKHWDRKIVYRDFCDCGGIILADTEDWENPKCYACYLEAGKKEEKVDL